MPKFNVNVFHMRVERQPKIIEAPTLKKALEMSVLGDGRYDGDGEIVTSHTYAKARVESSLKEDVLLGLKYRLEEVKKAEGSGSNYYMVLSCLRQYIEEVLPEALNKTT